MIKGKKILVISTAATAMPVPGPLERAGCLIDEVADAAEGLEKLERGGHDAVILQAAPDNESWILCERIRRLSPSPLVVISPRADADACVRAISAGADFFLRKPCGPLELIARIRSLFTRRQTQGQPEPAVS